MKAVLVDIIFTTRVIVPDNFNQDEDYSPEFVEILENRVLEKIQNNELRENIDVIEDDTECPFGTLNIDKDAD